MGFKQQLKDHFRWSTDYVALRHENTSDFYLSCWQTSRSPYPLLYIRFILFLGALSTVIASLVITEGLGNLRFWATYNTQWALVWNTVCTGLATAISAVACYKGPIESSSGLPWYIRLYWATYCVSVPLAYFVTVFYYSFLTDAYPEDFTPDPVLDVFIHGINSVVMFALMAVSQHPIYFCQFVYPVLHMAAYGIFSAIYYFAGGTSAYGEHFIYPMMDWTKPGPTVGVILVVMVILILLTVVAVILTLLRDYLSRKWDSNHTSL